MEWKGERGGKRGRRAEEDRQREDHAYWTECEMCVATDQRRGGEDAIDGMR